MLVNCWLPAFISFPGGKMDGSDTDLAHTALRETFEEIGLAGPAIDLWGYLDPVPSKVISIQ
jgi:8-oxo-dGTP pyrophosphatase MutT (NUDIX family)